MARDALVVGVNTYQYLPSLQAPARDAEAIAHQLQTQGDFRVHRLPEVIQAGQPQVGLKTPVTLKELEAALVRLFKPKGSNIPQTALFYFSGHGIQKEAGIQEGYLALSDSNPEAGFYGLSLFWLRRLLQESPVRQRIIWLDCCHSGELLNFLEADPGARPGTDRLFMAASREYESAYESINTPYSVFTQALLDGLDPQRSETGIVTNHSITAWVSQSLKGEIQQPLFESSGSEIILTRSIAPTRPEKIEASSATSAVCPYRGLAYFDEMDAEYFFGREDLTQQAIDQLHNKFVAVVGASGSGKSSLLRAGLLNRLRQGQCWTDSTNWQIKVITPGEHPLKNLAAAFVDRNTSALDRAEQIQRAEQFLLTGSLGLAQLVRASLLDDNRSTQPHLLLIVDQFEEAFTLCQNESERQQFFECLTGATASVEGFSIVIGLRSDFLGRCSQYETIAPLITANAVTVAPLTYEQIKSAITRPAQKVGLVCDPNLVYTMLLDVMGAPGELPLLQYTLQQLWQQRQLDQASGVARLTLDTYTALGGIRGTLQRQATEVFNRLSVEEQGIAQRIFLALTQLGEGTEDTRRRVLKSELVRPACSIEQIEQTLEKLVAAKLIVTSQGSDAPEAGSCQEAIDVAHEALIRNWPLLRTWLAENREVLRRQRRIEQAAQEWLQAGRAIAPEYLLHGARLLEAEDFVRRYAQELSALAQLYVQTSQKERDRVRRASRQLRVGLPAVVGLALLAAVDTTVSPWDNPPKAGLPISALATQVIGIPDASGTRGSSVAIQRLVIDGELQQAQAGLHCALAELDPQAEPTNRIVAAKSDLPLEPNQQYIATASGDGTLHLQEIDSPLGHLSSLDTGCANQQ